MKLEQLISLMNKNYPGHVFSACLQNPDNPPTQASAIHISMAKAMVIEATKLIEQETRDSNLLFAMSEMLQNHSRLLSEMGYAFHDYGDRAFNRERRAAQETKNKKKLAEIEKMKDAIGPQLTQPPVIPPALAVQTGNQPNRRLRQPQTATTPRRPRHAVRV